MRLNNERGLVGSWMVVAALAALRLGAACGGNAGSTLTSCPSPEDVVPGASCAEGFACTSSSSLADCPGSRGSLVCACLRATWTCSDPSESPCFPDAGAGDERGDVAADADDVSPGADGAGDADVDATRDAESDS